MAKNPQCQRCGDSLSALKIVPDQPAYPQGVCVLCAAELGKGNPDAEAKASADKLMGRAAELAGTMTRADALAGIAEVCGGAEGPLPAGGLDTGPDVAAGSGIPAWFDIPANVTVDYWEWRDGMGARWVQVEGARAALLPDSVKRSCTLSPGTYRDSYKPANMPVVHYRVTVLGKHKPDERDNNPPEEIRDEVNKLLDKVDENLNEAERIHTGARVLLDKSNDDIQERLRQVAATVLTAPTTTASPRDYFAAHVLPAFIKIVQSTGRGLTAAECYGKAAQHAYQQADAMLKARAVQPEQNALPPNEREELHKLRVFKTYVHSRLDAAGVEKDPESEHKAEGCRIGGRLDIVLRKFAEVEKWHLLSMLSRAGIGHGIRPDYDGGRPVGLAVLVENFGDGEDQYISEFQFDNAGALKAVHCYPHEGG